MLETEYHTRMLCNICWIGSRWVQRGVPDPSGLTGMRTIMAAEGWGSEWTEDGWRHYCPKHIGESDN